MYPRDVTSSVYYALSQWVGCFIEMHQAIDFNYSTMKHARGDRHSRGAPYHARVIVLASKYGFRKSLRDRCKYGLWCHVASGDEKEDASENIIQFVKELCSTRSFHLPCKFSSSSSVTLRTLTWVTTVTRCILLISLVYLMFTCLIAVLVRRWATRCSCMRLQIMMMMVRIHGYLMNCGRSANRQF